MALQQPHGPRAFEPQVLKRTAGRGPPPGRPLDQTALEKVGLIHVFDRVLLLLDRGGQRREAHRTTGELLANRAQDLAVETVQALAVDVEQLQRRYRDLLGACS